MAKAKPLFLLLALVVPTAHGQLFSNLNSNLGFEDATIQSNDPLQVDAAKALPLWSATINGSPVAQIWHDTITLNSPGVSMHDARSLFQPIAGKFSVFLQGGHVAGQGAAAIAQAGTINPRANSLLFSANNVTLLAVSFAGSTLPVVPLEAFSNYTRYGVDVSPFAGQTGELKFETPQEGRAFIDDLQFATAPIVPEPKTTFLMFAGSFLLLKLRHKTQPSN